MAFKLRCQASGTQSDTFREMIHREKQADYQQKQYQEFMIRYQCSKNSKNNQFFIVKYSKFLREVVRKK